ncbi:hypothetical protein V8E54_009164 [Elaphomyces granulatus]|uniref:RING-type domain-containing protein n=1 Tax=Elaphomyces granulatus TaxID=519963 RepID=A0A232LWN2_9EURO|nr:hypothetical protein Egran_03806 [Elaphomyces granulatus]
MERICRNFLDFQAFIMERRTSSTVDGSSRSVSRQTPPSLYIPYMAGPSSSRHGHEPRGIKRRRLSDENPSAGPSSTYRRNEEDIESLDLTEVDDAFALSKVLAKQREDAIKAQSNPTDRSGRSVLTSYKCPVCMDMPVDATTTICGHLFCHKCIIDTLRFGEEQRSDGSGKGPRGNCPVCRKPLSRNDIPGPKRNLVPLQLKLMTRKRDVKKQ